MNREEKKLILTNKSEMLKIIAHPMRLCIISCLMEKACNVSHLVTQMEVPQSTVSQHLSKLRSAGIIKGHRQGVEVKYQVTSQEVMDIVTLLLSDHDVKVLQQSIQ